MAAGHALDRRGPLAVARSHRRRARPGSRERTLDDRRLFGAEARLPRPPARRRRRAAAIRLSGGRPASDARVASARGAAITCRPRWSTASSQRWSRRTASPTSSRSRPRPTSPPRSRHWRRSFGRRLHEAQNPVHRRVTFWECKHVITDCAPLICGPATLPPSALTPPDCGFVAERPLLRRFAGL